MASVEKRGEGYQVRWWSVAGIQKKRLCPSLRSAKELQREVEACIAVGRDWEPEVVREDANLEAVMRAFIEHRALRLRPRTLHRYAENIDLLLRFLRQRQPRGKLLVTLLSKPLMEDYYAWLCRAENGLHGRARTPDTARKIAEVAQLMWEWADESDRWPDQIPRPKRIEMVRSDPAPVVAPTWAEMDACVLAARGWHQKLALFMRYTGLRVGECMLFEWRDVNMDKGTLTIRSEVNKTGAGRLIPLSPHLLDEIATWGVREGYVIPSGRCHGDRYRQARPRDIARAWARAGVREEAWVQPDHAFRRGWKSGMLALGAQPDAVDFLQGHALGHGGARARYIDPWQALPLVEVVKMVPKIMPAPRNVVAMPVAASAGR